MNQPTPFLKTEKIGIHQLHTQNGQAKAFLEIQLGAPAAPRPVEPSDVSLETREVEANSVKPVQYACELCKYTSQTEHGLNVHKGHKHKDVKKTPEKERSTSIQGDVSLSLTP